VRTLSKIAILISAITFASLVNTALAQEAAATSAPQNLVDGIAGPLGSEGVWGGWSALNLIPGASVFPVSSATTVLYIGFTAGTTANINNMVLYTTKRQSATITAVTRVTLKGVSNPSIRLTNCSTATPCIVRLDPIELTLSALNDYYFVVYFTNNSNNNALGATVPVYRIGSLTGFYVRADESRLKVAQSIPSGNFGVPYFLTYVMSD
jgi:hypothetical protein